MADISTICAKHIHKLVKSFINPSNRLSLHHPPENDNIEGMEDVLKIAGIVVVAIFAAIIYRATIDHLNTGHTGNRNSLSLYERYWP
ncbi:hypothetical protein IJ135_00585 [Candidatus Saccharibacteria bacterium]|nr:hypothetical protein [Candidatus Saccharibacteria bacterium]